MLTVSIGLLGIMSSVDCLEDITVEFATQFQPDMDIDKDPK